MAGVTHNHGRFSGEAGDVCDLQGSEWGTNDPSAVFTMRCNAFLLYSCCMISSAASAPHSDGARQDASNGAPVECAHDGWGSFRLLQFPEEVEAPLGFLRQRCSVGCPGEVLTDVKEFGAAHSLHSSTIDGQWWVFGLASLEVNNNLLGFADIQQEVVVSAPHGQKVDLLPVEGLVVLGDETHQSCIVRKLHHVISVVGWCAVMSQQGEEQGTEHTALGRPLC